MDITIADLGGVTRIKLSGSLDRKSAPDLESQFASIAENVQSAIIDLSSISTLPAVGVSALLNTAMAIAAHGGNLVLLNPQDDVRAILINGGIDHVAPIVFNDDEAEREARRHRSDQPG